MVPSFFYFELIFLGHRTRVAWCLRYQVSASFCDNGYSLSLFLYSYDDMDEMRPFSGDSRLMTAVSRRERMMDDDPGKKYRKI